MTKQKRSWAAIERHGTRAVTLGAQGELRFWDIDRQPKLHQESRVESARGLAIVEHRGVAVVATTHALDLYTISDGRHVEHVDLSRERHGIQALAISPNGAYAALAGFGEQIHLLAVDGWRKLAQVEGGEWINSVAFDASGERLASACSFQNGAMVRIDRVVADALEPVRELPRSDQNTPEQTFVDFVASVAWEPSGGGVALFETSSVGGLTGEYGWRGNIALYEPVSGALRWERTVGASVGGDRTTLAEAGYSGGYPARITFDAAGNVICGSTGGRAVALDGRTGERRALLAANLRDDMLAVISASDGRLWAASADGALHALKPTRAA